ncbi:MAG: RsmD family RNA methyltransferase [Bacteroidetes bacterium]|nr:RsmD family RNA methyltransferase [Bacteroidota bacterium]
MRIVSGAYKSRKLHPPGNLPVRPTTDFAKEALFNVLNNLIDYETTSVLDLFAGTGAISFEFVSRGCKRVTSLDNHPRCVSFIHKTAQEFNMVNLFTIKANALTFVRQAHDSWDLVFADPPYDLPQLPDLPGLVLSGDTLAPGGLFILEHPKKYSFAEIPGFEQHRKYGEVNFSFFRKTEN